MSTTTRKRNASDPYLEMVKAFPLKPIRSGAEYARAVAALNKLAVRDEGTLESGEQDYLETLALLVEKYDAEHHRIDTSKSSPLATLKYLMAQGGMTIADVGRIIGSQSAASMILNGKRDMSKAHIVALAAHFGVDAGAFL